MGDHPAGSPCRAFEVWFIDVERLCSLIFVGLSEGVEANGVED